MKRTIKTPICLLVSAFALSLTGCNINVFTVDKKDISYYSLINQGEEWKDISNYKKGDISSLIVDKQEHVPYMTLETYTSMLLPYKKAGFDYRVSDVGGSTMFMVTSGSSYLFAVEFNQLEKTISLSGDPASSLTTNKDYTNSSLYVGGKIDASMTASSGKPVTYSWDNTTYRVFVHDNLTYLPLSLLDAVIAPNTGIHHYYSYKNIYQYLTNEELKNVLFYSGNELTSAYGEANDIIKNDLVKMPEYLREDRYNAFLFILENLYGLKSTRKIDSMTELFKENNLLNDFMSGDDDARNKAYASVFAFLDEGHSQPADKFEYPWSTGTQNSLGPTLTNMIQTAALLYTSRVAFYKSIDQTLDSVVYLSDEVAYFPFDGFTFVENAYNEDGSVREDIADLDSYFRVAKNLKDIKDHGGVKKVVIDISVNGGGTLGVMMKILSLLSKNNSSKTFMKTDKSNDIVRYIAKVDSNLDGDYNLDDVYGDDFKIYLLTSCYSYSCGNALPFLAQKQNIATIIGQNSGGGECAVAEAYLPSGEYFVHSSLYHIGFVENDYDRWIGSEETAKADKLIDYDKYFDIPTLLSSL